MQLVKILVVEDDLQIGKSLVSDLEVNSYIVTDLVTNQTDALVSFRKNKPDIVIADIELVHKGSRRIDRYGGVELINYITSKYDTPCIYYTGNANRNEYLERAAASNHLGIINKSKDDFNQILITIKSVILKHFNSKINTPNQLDYFFCERLEDIRGTNSTKIIQYKIMLEDIVWIEYKSSKETESKNNQIEIYVENDASPPFIRTNLPLKQFLLRYPKPFFMRISNHHIINEKKLKGIIPETLEAMVIFNKERKFLPITESYQGIVSHYLHSSKLKSN